MNDCYILDCFSKIYIWIGSGSNKFEQNGAQKRASKYLETILDGRDKTKVHIIDVLSGKEPPFFCVQFPDWCDEIAKAWLVVDSFEHLKAKTETEAVPENKVKTFHDPATFKVPYAEIKNGQAVPGIKGAKREDYLTNEEFEEVFGMKKSEYDLKKVWEKQSLKKKYGLF